MEKAELIHKDIMIKFAKLRKKPTNPETIRNNATGLKFYTDMAETIQNMYPQYYGGKQKPIVIRFDPKVFGLK